MNEQTILERENWAANSKRVVRWEGYWQCPSHWPAINLIPNLEVSFETVDNGEGRRLEIRLPQDLRLNVLFNFWNLACGVSVFTGIRLVK